MIPIISKLMGKAKKLQAPRPNSRAPHYNPRLHRVKAEPLVVIVVPTRELAVQIFNEACRMCYRSMLRPCAAYGGRPMGKCLWDDVRATETHHANIRAHLQVKRWTILDLAATSLSLRQEDSVI